MKKTAISTLLILCIMTIFAAQISAEKTKIVWATDVTSETTHYKVYTILAQNYMAAHPDVEIALVTPPGSYYDGLLTWIAAGVGPDVMWLGQNLISFSDLLLPLDDLVQKDKNVAAIHPNILRAGRWGQKQIGLTYGINTNVVYYNKQMFAAAGTAAPTDSWVYSDMVSKGRKIIKDSNGDGKTDKWGVAPFITTHSMVQGGDFYSADGKRANFVNPVSIETTQFIIDLNNGKYDICYPQVPSAQRAPMFFNENVAMYTTGIFFVPDVRSKAKFDWDVIPFPGMVKDGKRYDSAFVSMESWAVYKDSKNAAIAKDFVSWLFKPESMEIITAAGLVIPSQPQQWPQFMAQPTPPNNIKAFLQTVDYAHQFHFDHPIGQYVTGNILHTKNAIYNNMQKGNVPVATAFLEIEKQINAYLDEWWASRK